MKTTITIGNKDTELVANAATPFYFTQVFNEDFFVRSQEVTDGNEGAAVDLFSKMGYIMAKQAEGANMKKLSIDDYVNWLEGYEAMDLAIATGDIAMFYSGQTTPTAKPKK